MCQHESVCTRQAIQTSAALTLYPAVPTTVSMSNGLEGHLCVAQFAHILSSLLEDLFEPDLSDRTSLVLLSCTLKTEETRVKGSLTPFYSLGVAINHVVQWSILSTRSDLEFPWKLTSEQPGRKFLDEVHWCGKTYDNSGQCLPLG